MQIAKKIKIIDHDNQHYGKSSGFKFWVRFQTINGEDHAYVNFADFACYLVASGEFDGYNDETDDGELWRTEDPDTGRGNSYTFNEVISNFISTSDFDQILAEYISVKMVIEDLVLEA